MGYTDLYRFPVGVIFDGTTPTAEPTISFPRSVTVNGVRYGSDIFEKWNSSQLAELGIKQFVEDVVSPLYDAGTPVDVETDDVVHRTYPNAVFNYARATNEFINKINNVRKEHEENGFIHDHGLDVFINTDIKGSLRMTQMAFVFQADPTHIEVWKGVDPSTGHDKWFNMTATIYQEIVTTGQEYVRACFLRQKELQGQLATLPQTPEAYLAFESTIETGWPT